MYVYIEAEWTHEESGKTISNRMIVADWILQSPDDRKDVATAYQIKVNNKMVEYQLRDVYKKLAGRKIKISLNIDYTPTFGFFFKVLLLFTQDRLKELDLQVPVNYMS